MKFGRISVIVFLKAMPQIFFKSKRQLHRIHKNQHRFRHITQSWKVCGMNSHHTKTPPRVLVEGWKFLMNNKIKTELCNFWWASTIPIVLFGDKSCSWILYPLSVKRILSSPKKRNNENYQTEFLRIFLWLLSPKVALLIPKLRRVTVITVIEMGTQ